MRILANLNSLGVGAGRSAEDGAASGAGPDAQISGVKTSEAEARAIVLRYLERMGIADTFDANEEELVREISGVDAPAPDRRDGRAFVRGFAR